MADTTPTCGCGCGLAVPLATYSRHKKGQIKGQPLKYLKGHYLRDTTIREASHYVVEDRGYDTPCWIWKRRFDPDGYGVIGDNDRAHRRSYRQRIGPIPDGMILHHLCEQRACVRGSHLVPVTPTEHKRLHSVLDPDAVRAIRASTTKTQQQLAEEFGTTRSNIGYIRRGHIW